MRLPCAAVEWPVGVGNGMVGLSNRASGYLSIHSINFASHPVGSLIAGLMAHLLRHGSKKGFCRKKLYQDMNGLK